MDWAVFPKVWSMYNHAAQVNCRSYMVEYYFNWYVFLKFPYINI